MLPLTITFLGSGDAFGSGGRFQACILVESFGSRGLIDCGASSLVAMKKHGVDPNSIDYTTLESQRARLSRRRLVVTHMNQDMISRVSRLRVEAAYDGMVIRL